MVHERAEVVKCSPRPLRRTATSCRCSRAVHQAQGEHALCASACHVWLGARSAAFGAVRSSKVPAAHGLAQSTDPANASRPLVALSPRTLVRSASSHGPPIASQYAPAPSRPPRATRARDRNGTTGRCSPPESARHGAQHGTRQPHGPTFRAPYRAVLRPPSRSATSRNRGASDLHGAKAIRVRLQHNVKVTTLGEARLQAAHVVRDRIKAHLDPGGTSERR